MVGKKGVRSLYLFKITKYKSKSDLENLISFSVIYKFIGLRYEITKIYAPLTKNSAQTEQ